MTKTKGAAIGAAVLAWGLVACGAAPPAPLPTAGAPATTPSETTAAPSPIETAPSHPPLPSLALAQPGPRPELPGHDSLIGLSSDAVTALLGPPQFRRREAPAEIWRYRTKTCFLDLFLYQDSDALQVAHVEVRGPDVATIWDKACYLGLLVERSRAKAL